MDRKTFFNLEKMMYGFGDEKNANPESKELMEQFLVDFIDKIVKKGMKRSNARGMYNKIIKDDILYLIKDNPKYVYRIAYIITKKREIKKVMDQTKKSNL